MSTLKLARDLRTAGFPALALKDKGVVIIGRNKEHLTIAHHVGKGFCLTTPDNHYWHYRLEDTFPTLTTLCQQGIDKRDQDPDWGLV